MLNDLLGVGMDLLNISYGPAASMNAPAAVVQSVLRRDDCSRPKRSLANQRRLSASSLQLRSQESPPHSAHGANAASRAEEGMLDVAAR